MGPKKLEELLSKLFVDDDKEAPEKLWWPFWPVPDSCPYSYYSSDED